MSERNKTKSEVKINKAQDKLLKIKIKGKCSV